MRGAATVIVAVLLLIVIGIALAVALQSASSNFSDVDSQSNTADALYLAESAIERALYRASTNIICTSLGPDPAVGDYALGRGTFAVTSATVVSASLCDVNVIGTVGLSQRKLHARIQYNPGMPIDEPFPNLADFTTHWPTEVLTQNKGLSRYVAANCPAATCVNTVAGSGSFYAETDVANPGGAFTGYRERLLAVPISTGATGLNINYYVGFMKTKISGNPLKNIAAIDLVDSTLGISDNVWQDATTSAGWQYINGLPKAMPANRTYDRIHIRYDMQEALNGSPGRQVTMNVDDIRITKVGANVALVTWTELVP